MADGDQPGVAARSTRCEIASFEEDDIAARIGEFHRSAEADDATADDDDLIAVVWHAAIVAVGLIGTARPVPVTGPAGGTCEACSGFGCEWPAAPSWTDAQPP